MSWVKAKRAIRDVLAGIHIEKNWIGNPSAEFDLSFITATGCSIVQSAEAARFGTQSVKATGSAGASDRIEWPSAGVNLPVIAGEPYFWGIYIKPAGAYTVISDLTIKWYDAAVGGSLISETNGVDFSIPSGSDFTRYMLEAEAPTGALGAVAVWNERSVSFTTIRSLYFDGAFFAHGYERPYFDGTSPGCEWDNEPPTDPDNSNRIIKRVYEDPPGTIQDTPCFVIFPPPVANELHMGQRWRSYEVPVQCFISDQDKDQEAALIDLARERLIPAFDGATAPLEWANPTGLGVSLGGGATHAYVKSVGPGAGLEYPRNSGKVYAGFEATIFVEIKEAVDFQV